MVCKPLHAAVLRSKGWRCRVTAEQLASFEAWAARLLAAGGSLESVEVTDLIDSAQLRSLRNTAWAGSLRALELGDAGPEAFAALDGMTQLQALSYRFGYLVEPEAPLRPRLPGLTMLALHNSCRDVEFSLDGLPRLERLVLESFDSSGIVLMRASQPLSRLTTLSFESDYDNGVEEVAFP